MAILSSNMVLASSDMANVLAVGGTGVQIGNVVRDTATGGNWTAPFITAGQHLTTLAELAGKSLAKTSAGLEKLGDKFMGTMDSIADKKLEAINKIQEKPYAGFRLVSCL